MYFHVEIRQLFSEVKFELDLHDKEDIIERILIPYLKNEVVILNGLYVQYYSISQIIIKESQFSSRDFESHEYQRKLKEGKNPTVDPTGIMYNQSYAIDITNKMFDLARTRIEVQKQMEKTRSKSQNFTLSEIVLPKVSTEVNIPRVPVLETEVVSSSLTSVKQEVDRTKVFIVHGHDDLAKTQVSELIRRLGLTPIILHQQANGGKTIIEKIESYSNVGFGVVLYTPCDLGSKLGEEHSLNPRARQNVVFEHGFLIGKIGRENVAALVKNTVETPNDISGVVYIPMMAEGNWEIQLAKELKSSGYEINLNLL
ncbi:nucleotide-binding protein [Bacillus cereus]|uniref:nucleotide-binding protein n=1 Tax=Bacillus cereus TaxID=1396 RepID=UPI00211D5DDB|nr:nucleotide-binding protein [Bacillus cereus]